MGNGVKTEQNIPSSYSLSDSERVAGVISHPPKMIEKTVSFLVVEVFFFFVISILRNPLHATYEFIPSKFKSTFTNIHTMCLQQYLVTFEGHSSIE